MQAMQMVPVNVNTSRAEVTHRSTVTDTLLAYVTGDV
jgi:hypothetical protein